MNGASAVAYENAERTLQIALCSGNQDPKVRIGWRKEPRDHRRVRGLLEIRSRRQAVFFRRLNGSFPVTTDPILEKFKFTNAYRILDRTTQYLVREVIMKGEQSSLELFFRILLFKLFNKIETLPSCPSAPADSPFVLGARCENKWHTDSCPWRLDGTSIATASRYTGLSFIWSSKR